MNKSFAWATLLVLISVSPLVHGTPGRMVSGERSRAAASAGASSPPVNSNTTRTPTSPSADDSNDLQEPNSKDEQPCLDRDDKGGEHSARLHAQAPGVSLPHPGTLLTAVTIVNRGKESAEDVEVISIELAGGKLTSSLPAKLGTIKEKSSAFLDADFDGPFKPRQAHLLLLRGTYFVGHEKRRRCTFQFELPLRLPPEAPGSAELKTIQAEPLKVSGAPFPARPPKFDSEVNQSEWTVPKGPFIAAKPTPTHTGTERAQIGDPPSVDFVANDSLGVGGSSVAEPSGGLNSGGVIFSSANWLAAYSTNGGNSFTQLNPTTIFPNDAIGFCCDQIVQYAPSIDRFIWLLQGNGERLAVASPAQVQSSGGTAWTYWNLTPALFGFSGSGFDYPDLSIGDNYLYMSWNVSGKGHLVVRTALAGLQAGGTINLGFTNPADSSMAWFAHLVQDPRDEIFWAGHNNTSSMRIFNLPETSNSYFWRDVNVSTWTNSGFVSNSPDSQNWLGEMNSEGTWVAGGTRTANDVWFAWTAGPDKNFRQPHVDMVVVNPGNNFHVDQQVQIWNSDYAFAYPALSTNKCTGEVGLSLEYGGGGNYENHVVGFWGDFLVYITTASNTGTTRFGDYVTIRQAAPTNANPGNLFDAFGYGITGGTTDIHYVLFGRPASGCKSR